MGFGCSLLVVVLCRLVVGLFVGGLLVVVSGLVGCWLGVTCWLLVVGRGWLLVGGSWMRVRKLHFSSDFVFVCFVGGSFLLVG